MSHANLCVLTW